MAKRFGKKVSKTIDDKINAKEPELPQHLIFFFQAFKDLGTQRQVGMSIGCIPFFDIITYSRLYGCDEETEEDLLFFVRELDNHYIEMVNSEQKKKMNQSKSSPKKK